MHELAPPLFPSNSHIDRGLPWRRQLGASYNYTFTISLVDSSPLSRRIDWLLSWRRQAGAVYNNDATTTADSILSGFNSLGIVAQACVIPHTFLLLSHLTVTVVMSR